MPKTFLADTGLAAHVLMADASALRPPDHPAIGGLVETFVFTELTKLSSVSPSSAHAANPVWLRDRVGDRFTAGILLHQGDAIGSIGDRIQLLPLSTLWQHAPLP